MQRYDWSASYYMIYAGVQGPWRSWIQVLSKNYITNCEKCYKLGWKPDPSNAQDQKREITREWRNNFRSRLLYLDVSSAAHRFDSSSTIAYY